MGSKSFAKQLTLIVLSTAVVLLSACSEIIELPETEAQTPEATSLNTTIENGISTSAATAIQSNLQTPESQIQSSETATNTSPPSTVPTSTTTPNVLTPSTPISNTEPQIASEADEQEPLVSTPTTTPIVEALQSPETPQETPEETTEQETEITQPQTLPEAIVSNPESQIASEPQIASESQTPITATPVVPEAVVNNPQPTTPVVTTPVVTTPVVTTPATTQPVSQAPVWQPNPGTSWQWQLSGTLDLSLDVEMYDIDLFDTKQSVIDQLHAEGRIVICYFSAGSLEPWRTDASEFPTEVIGSKMSGWDEFWLDISKIDQLASIMTARLDLAAEKGCDGVEPDNVDAYQNNSGFPLSTQDQLNYNIFLAEEAHKRGLSIGLKNSVELVAELEPYFDWALNESCFQWNECHLLQPFIDNDKAVFGVEYSASISEFCDLVNGFNYDFLKKDYDLKAPMQPCRIMS